MISYLHDILIQVKPYVPLLHCLIFVFLNYKILIRMRVMDISMSFYMICLK